MVDSTRSNGQFVDARVRSQSRCDYCVVGGSAVTLHDANVHASLDIDLAILTGIESRKIDEALVSLGYAKRGRSYAR